MKNRVIKVLLIEDNPADVRLVEEMLTESHDVVFKLEKANQLSEGLERVEQNDVDVILLDLFLPDSKRIETIRRVHSEIHHIPIVVLTRFDDLADGVAVVQAGAQDYLIKGQFTSNMLIRSIRYSLERNRLEGVLRDSEERFRITFEQSAVGIAHAALTGRFLRVNQKLCEFLGYSRDELLELTFQKITHPDDLGPDLANMRHLLAGDFPTYSLEKRYITKDGCETWGNLTVGLVRSALGEPKYFSMVVEDINERKKAQQTQQYLAAIVENSDDGIIGKTLDGTVVSWNKGAEAIFGYTNSEMIGNSIQILYPRGYEKEFETVMARAERGEHITRLETKRICKDGSEVDIALSLSPIVDTDGSVIGVSTIERNITEQKRIEAAIAQAHARIDQERRQLRTILEVLPVGVFIADADGKIITTNEEVNRVWNGKAPLSQSFAEYRLYKGWWSDTNEPLKAEDWALYRAIRFGEVSIGEVIDIERFDGTRGTILNSAVPIKDANGAIIGGVVAIMDITERRRIETAEREQRILAEALRDTANALNSMSGLPDVLDRILNNVERVIAYDAAEIMLIENEEAHIVRSRGYDHVNNAMAVAELHTPIRNISNLRYMLESRQPIIIPDLNTYPTWIRTRVSHEQQWRSYVGVPIYLHDEIIGFINLASSTPNFFTPIHADRLQAFAEQTAIAIQNIEAYKQAQELTAFQERQRLARDLHDAVSQTLFSASVTAEALIRQYDRDPDKVRERLMQLHQLTRGALAEMRTLLLELRPTSLLEVHLSDLFKQLVEAVQSRKMIDIDIAMEDDLDDLPPDVKLAFYRITQESLNNIAKHARATKAEIIMNSQAKHIELIITDNGRGFDPGTIASTSMGLSIMQERAKGASIALEVDTKVGEGTRVRAVWTIDQQ